MIGRINSDWELIEEHTTLNVFGHSRILIPLFNLSTPRAICEEQDHHADFELGWGRVKAMIWTHKINGLTESDFVLALQNLMRFKVGI